MTRLLISTLFCLMAGLATALSQPLREYRLNGTTALSTLPRSNVVNDIRIFRDTVWLGTENGLTATADGGAHWFEFSGSDAPANNSISAVAMNDSVIWAAAAFTSKQADQSLPAGGGLFRSTDRGLHWVHIPQPVDSGLVDTLRDYGATGIRSLAITTEINNLTYDIAVTGRDVWIASFAGMLRRSSDGGATWRKVVLPPDTGQDFISATDTLHFDLAPTGGKAGLTGNLNHRVFSVYAQNDTTIWVGTAGGINRTTDGGVSWRKFSHQNQAQPISGNFVVSICGQDWNGRHLIWAATVNAEAADEVRGVSFTDDDGVTWKTALHGTFTHNVTAHDSVVYAATDDGTFRSDDFGVSWHRSGSIRDGKTGARIADAAAYAVAAAGDSVWIGGPEGLAVTPDNAGEPFGARWSVFRTYQPLASGASTYAYPNPFSPSQEVVRLHYRLNGTAGASPRATTIRIFDFGMMPVRVVVQNAPRPVGVDLDDLWDGRDDHGNRVANGVYFYRIEDGDGSPFWGKIMVLQ